MIVCQFSRQSLSLFGLGIKVMTSFVKLAGKVSSSTVIYQTFHTTQQLCHLDSVPIFWWYHLTMADCYTVVAKCTYLSRIIVIIIILSSTISWSTAACKVLLHFQSKEVGWVLRTLFYLFCIFISPIQSGHHTEKESLAAQDQSVECY